MKGFFGLRIGDVAVDCGENGIAHGTLRTVGAVIANAKRLRVESTNRRRRGSRPHGSPMIIMSPSMPRAHTGRARAAAVDYTIITIFVPSALMPMPVRGWRSRASPLGLAVEFTPPPTFFGLPLTHCKGCDTLPPPGRIDGIVDFNDIARFQCLHESLRSGVAEPSPRPKSTKPSSGMAVSPVLLGSDVTTSLNFVPGPRTSRHRQRRAVTSAQVPAYSPWFDEPRNEGVYSVSEVRRRHPLMPWNAAVASPHVAVPR